MRLVNLVLGGLLTLGVVAGVAGDGDRILAAEDSPARILLLGDSLTSGFGLPRQAAFPARLAAALDKTGISVEVIDAGVSGDTTAGGRARLDWVLADRPDIVVLELGANDGLRGLDPAETYANLDAILARLSAEGIRILLAGMMAPPNLGREYAAAFNAVYPRLAHAHGTAFYAFFLDGVAAEPTLNQADGLHPNALGVDVIVERITPHILALIEVC